MGKRSDYKKDRAWTAWDMNCRQICPVDSPSRRKLRDILRRQSRKRINRDAELEDVDETIPTQDFHMDCPWYLGFQATEECLKTCTITDENRDDSVCPESSSVNDDDMT